jgi:hemolysin activation/secretion protein
VIKGLFTDSIYSGFNSRTEIGLNYILYRDSQRITTAGISGWYRISENLINGAEIPVQRRKNAALVYELKHQEFLNWGNITANLQYIHGINAVDAIPAPEETTGEGTWKPRFWNFDLTLNRPFKWDQQTFNYSSRFSAQWNETPLIPQDRFTIGNRWTVRGFEPDNSLFSERGWFWQNELSWVVPVIRQQLYAAVDYGEVDGPSADRLVGRRLMGAALGLRGGWKVFNYDVFLSTPIIRPASYPEKELLFNFRIGMNY